MEIRVFSSLLVSLLLVFFPILEVNCQVDPEKGVSDFVGDGELGIVGDPSKTFGDGTFSPAPGVHTLCVFPKNAARLVPAGEKTEILVGVHNEGESVLNVIGISASVHLPYDHRMRVQNLTAQDFVKANVPYSVQATFPYTFVVSKYLQPGSFDLVGTIIYEIDQQPYQSFFYNGTIEVIEAGDVFSMESVFLVMLGVALIGLFGLWANGQIQQLSKKTKKVPKVEVGTKTTDADLDEWLQGTAYTRSLSKKSKKK